MNEEIVGAVTILANAKLQQKHPALSIKEWEVKLVLEAWESFMDAWEKQVDGE